MNKQYSRISQWYFLSVLKNHFVWCIKDRICIWDSGITWIVYILDAWRRSSHQFVNRHLQVMANIHFYTWSFSYGQILLSVRIWDPLEKKIKKLIYIFSQFLNWANLFLFFNMCANSPLVLPQKVKLETSAHNAKKSIRIKGKLRLNRHFIALWIMLLWVGTLFLFHICHIIIIIFKLAEYTIKKKRNLNSTG